MVTENKSTNEVGAVEKHSRRRFFSTALKIGAGLVAFAPTLKVLAKDTSPQFGKAIPNYIPCSQVGPCVMYDPCVPDGGKFDRRYPTYFCYCCDGS